MHGRDFSHGLERYPGKRPRRSYPQASEAPAFPKSVPECTFSKRLGADGEMGKPRASQGSKFQESDGYRERRDGPCGGQPLYD